MKKIVVAALTGALFGIIVMQLAGPYWSDDSSPEAEQGRDIVAGPKLSPAIAEKHRNEQYENLHDIRGVVSLPTEYSRTQALYALAGRSDSAAVQNLIFQADRVADDVERLAMLDTLFFRLAETDPESALTLSRINQFGVIDAIEQVVWRTWARNDLEAALFAAKSQTRIQNQHAAAQSLYAAFGYLGNATTDYINSELGVDPNRTTRNRYIKFLTEKSIGMAIDFINNLSDVSKRQEYISWLANDIAVRESESALRYASLFDTPAAKTAYENAVNDVVAREDPKAVLDKLIANGQKLTSSREVYIALQSLVVTDIESAKKFFSRANGAQERQNIGSAIAAELAKHDAAEALAWASQNDTRPMPMLRLAAIRQIALTDPQMAMTEALSIENTQIQRMLVSSVVQQMSMHDPASAATYLDQIDNKQQRQESVEQIATMWVQRDADAALDWIGSQDEETSGDLLRVAGMTLVHTNPDAAMRLLPKMNLQTQTSMRQQIAQVLVTTRSITDAQTFIAQFAAQPGFDQLQASLISGLVESDVMMAKQLANQLAEGPARDRAYVQIIDQQAQSDPIEAARLLKGIKSESSRGAAAGQLAARWYENDPNAAMNWISKMSSGASRDNAISQMASRTRRPPVEMIALIDTIDDNEKRGQAKMSQVYRLMRVDPVRANALSQDQDISDEQRQQLEATFTRMGIAISTQ